MTVHRCSILILILLSSIPAAAQIVVPTYTKATLPAPGTPGRLAAVTDMERGLWMDAGPAWLAIGREELNVKEFGAEGDGVTDDTNAIQQAVDTAVQIMSSSVNAVVVFFPRGIYKITAAVTVQNTVPPPGQSLPGQRLVLRGSGFGAAGSASILKTDERNINMIDATNFSDVLTIEHLSFHGPLTEADTSGTTNAVKIGALVDGRIRHNWFTMFPNAAVYAQHLHGYHIHDNGIENSKYGLYIEHGENDIIQNNRFYSLAAAGIYLVSSKFLQIQNNHFDLCGRDTSRETDRTNPTAAIVVSKTGGSPPVDPNPEVRQLLISNNQFNQNGNDIAILGNGNASAHVGVTNAVVIGNNSDFTRVSFLVVNAASNVAVMANRVNDSGQRDDNFYAALDILGSSHGIWLYDNINTMQAGAVRAKYGLSVGNSATGIVIGINHFSGATSSLLVPSQSTYPTAVADAAVHSPFVTDGPETGSAGLRFHATAANIWGGVNVQFRRKRKSAPSGITLTGCIKANVPASDPLITSITDEGFRFNILSVGAGDTFAVDCKYAVVP